MSGPEVDAPTADTGPHTTADAPTADTGAGLPTTAGALAELGLPPTGVPASTSTGQDVIFPPLDRYHATVTAYKVAGFGMLADLTATDYLTHPGRTLPDGVAPERFELVTMLLSLSRAARVRVRVQVPEDSAVVPSVWDLYPGAEAMEREVFDMFGIRFTGHPDLTRILMPEDWEGYPLRKDYGIGRVPVQFKEAPGPR
jgi:NADH-quinone oxidoreductase subunit C